MALAAGEEESMTDHVVLPCNSSRSARLTGNHAAEYGESSDTNAWLKYYADDGQAYWSNGIESVWEDPLPYPETELEPQHETRQSRWLAVQQAVGGRHSLADKTC